MSDFYRKTVAEIMASLDSSPAGLEPEEAERRLALHGYNELATRSGVHPLLIFLNQFKSFIIYILLFAVVFSLLIGEYVDTLIILAILVANALIGFFQELSAGRSLEALKKMSTVRATVHRGGEKRMLDARFLVPGDIIELEAGDRVPADGRLVEAARLKLEEAALTGESLPVEKSLGEIDRDVSIGDRKNMVFFATSVAAGHAKALVVATGMQTELGKITAMVQEAGQEMTPLQKRLDRFGKKLGVAIVGICMVVFFLSVGKEYLAGVLNVHAIIEFAFVAISLAVAAVPTALPAVVTIALSVGAKRLLRKKALVRNLSSVETLGSCDAICSDKTGTLTENRMTVRYAWSLDGETTLSGTGYGPDGEVSGPVSSHLFRCGVLCNNASLRKEEGGQWRISGDPTEAALLASAAKVGVKDSGTRRINEIPFDSERKLMSVLVRDGAGETVYTKGALQSVLKRCSRALADGREESLTDALRQRIEGQNAQYARRALRVLAFAMKRDSAAGDFQEGELTFIGLQAMIDPPRPEVTDSIAKARRAGIRILMITGDYEETARAVGREIGIEGELVTGEQLARMDADALQSALRRQTNIFARVDPEHKLRIVEALQRMGHTVAMTGDGVNDAPALKKANIGVAVGSGTDAAKESADFVLLDDSFTHIVNAVEEGRGIYDNIQKSIMLLLSGNLGEVLIIFLAVLFGMNLPLTAILLLWINLVTDGAPALAYSVDPYGRDIMRRRPKPREEGILPADKLALLGVLGCLGTALALTLFYLYGGASDSSAALRHARSMVFNFVVLYELVLTFVIRRDYLVPLFANRWVWGAAGLAVALQALLLYTPLAQLFDITPLSLVDIGFLGAGGLLFWGVAVSYQRMAKTQSKVRQQG